jgi:glycosyltransferase involved in cell wall biosynthesis
MHQLNSPVVSFIVPALNEELNLPPLFERLLALEKTLAVPIEILVVDDASNDRTFQIASEAAAIHSEIRALHKPLPHGLGRGVRFGLERARGKMGVVVMADGVDPLESAVSEFCQKILTEGCQLVLLSRYRQAQDSVSIPLSYKVCHSVFRFFTAQVLGVPYPDTTYAFRAFDISFAQSLSLRSNGFEISPELTFKTFFAGGRIGEVAGSQTRRVRGKSSFAFSKAARDYGRVLLEAFGMRLRRAKVAKRMVEMR